MFGLGDIFNAENRFMEPRSVQFYPERLSHLLRGRIHISQCKTNQAGRE